MATLTLIKQRFNNIKQDQIRFPGNRKQPSSQTEYKIKPRYIKRKYTNEVITYCFRWQTMGQNFSMV